MAKIADVQEVAVVELRPYERNAKTHSPDQIEKIAKSIEEFGFLSPCLIDKDKNIIAGHGRMLAALKLGMETVPCVFIEGLTDAQRRAYILADNKLTELGGWDEELVQSELEWLNDMNFDVSLTGFDFSVEIADADDEEIEEDEYDDSPPPRTKRGDVWQLGRHRLMCGDSTNQDDVVKLMDGKFAKILFTSPPYADLRDYEDGKDLSINNLSQFIKVYRPYTEYQCVNLGMIIRQREIVPYWDEYIDAAHDAGYKLMAWNVWDKTMCGSVGQQHNFFPTRHEWIFVFGTEFYDTNLIWDKQEASINRRPNRTVRQKDGSTKMSTNGDTSNPKKKMESVLYLCSENGTIRKEHPAVFPVGLPAEYMKSMTQENDIVIEPFCGSGTTLIAAEHTGRICYGMELDQKYCDVIINRWEQLTGEKAVLLNG